MLGPDASSRDGVRHSPSSSVGALRRRSSRRSGSHAPCRSSSARCASATPRRERRRRRRAMSPRPGFAGVVDEQSGKPCATGSQSHRTSRSPARRVSTAAVGSSRQTARTGWSAVTVTRRPIFVLNVDDIAVEGARRERGDQEGTPASPTPGRHDSASQPSAPYAIDLGEQLVEPHEPDPPVAGGRAAVSSPTKQLPPQPGAGAEELGADALVVAHAEHDVVDVGADGLAHGGDGVDEADLGGQERVGGVLDRLGRGRVGDDRRRGDPEVQRRHPDGGGLVVGADDDPVGVEEVVHGRALAEELGVRHDEDVGPAQDPLDDPGRTDGHGRLVDDDRVRLQRTADRARRRLDVGQVGGAVRRPAASARTGRRTRRPPRPRRCRRRTEAPARQALADEVVEPVLEDRALACSSRAMRPRRCRRTRPGDRGGRSRRPSSARRSRFR